MEQRLPTPSLRPEAHVVLYDGACPFCRLRVEQLARWDTGQHLAYLSLHDSEVARRWPDLRREQLMQQMFIMTSDSRQLAGVFALRFLSRILWRLWPVAVLLHIPYSAPVWQWLYLQVANRRYTISKYLRCSTDACRVDVS